MKQWYALRSKPKKEELAAAMLERAAIEVYVPRVRVRQQAGRPPLLVPFFPGYFFSRLDPDLGETHLARYSIGVLSIVGYGGEPWPIPEDLIVSIQERLARSPKYGPGVGFRAGDRVMITGGPFRDLEAIFDCHLSAGGRARVLIQMLQRLCKVELSVSQLRRFTEAAGVALG